MSRLLLIATVPVGWQYTLQHFHEDVRNITDKASSAYSKAMVAGNNAREDATAASNYESQALETAAKALRDSRMAQGIKATDFFEESVEAWAAIGRMTNATGAAESEGNTALGYARQASNVQHPNSTARSLAENYFERAKVANDFTKEANAKAKWAQAAVAEFRTAKGQNEQAREEEQQNCTTTVNIAEKITERIASISTQAHSAITGAEEVRRFAAEATAAAIEGHMDKADSLVNDAKKESVKVEEAAKQVALAKKKARELLIKLMLRK